MSTIIRFKRKLSKGNDGITLLPGEPFFNTVNKHFYVGNADGTLQDVAGIKINNDAADDTVEFNIGEDLYKKTINNVDNVSKTVGGRSIDEIFEKDSPVVKTSSVSNCAHDVTTTINSKNISDIFDTDGVTAKKATTATKLSSTSVGSVKHPVYFNNEGKPVQTTYSLDVATDKDYGLIKLGNSTTGNQRSVMKANDDGDAYVDVTDINTNISNIDTRVKNCETLLTWETF